MPTKNLRHGRLRVQSGDTPTALTKTLAFTDGDFTWTRTKNVNPILDRGRLSHLRQGDQQGVEWSFTAKFVDRTLHQLLDEYVFDTETELIGSLTGGALNSDIATAFAFRQGSLIVTDGAPFTGNKLAPGSTPATDGEHAENVGALDVEDVLSVSAFDIFMPAADVDVNVTFDAIGASTLDDGTSDVKTLDLIFEVLDPGQPISPGTVVETYNLISSTMTEESFEEGDEFDTVSISGLAFILRLGVSEASTP